MHQMRPYLVVAFLFAIVSRSVLADRPRLTSPNHEGAARFSPTPKHPRVWIPATGNASSALDLSFENVPLVNGSAVWGNVSAHVARTASPAGHWHVYCPGCSGVDSCTGNRSDVSAQATQHNCTYATNGGPFGMLKPLCMGPMVSDGVIVANKTSDPGTVCIGYGQEGGASSSSASWFFGAIDDDEAVANLLPRMENLLCGFGWVAYNGVAEPYHAGGLIAPRTIIGIDGQGALVLAVVDGSEVMKTGMTMAQVAAYAVDTLGLAYAINLDGGGSSTSFYPAQGGVQGCPTAIDFPVCLERPVVTISCLR